MRPVEAALGRSVPTTTEGVIGMLETALSLLAGRDSFSPDVSAATLPWNGRLAARLIENGLSGLKSTPAGAAHGSCGGTQG